jgi:hypothetical protein
MAVMSTVVLFLGILTLGIVCFFADLDKMNELLYIEMLIPSFFHKKSPTFFFVRPEKYPKA